MDSAKQHWKILQGLGTDLANRVREFMVIGWNGDGVIVATEDGLTFWLGTMKFGWGERKTATKPTLLEVTDLVQMAQSHQHILLLNKRGEIYSMGRNHWGQLGLGTKVEEIHFTPQLIPIPQHKFISFRCGIGYSVALTEDGKVWAWGRNCFSQVGVPSSTHYYLPSPRQIPELNPHRVVAVECGSAHSLALTDQGEVYIWGLIRYRELERVCPDSVRNGNLSVICQYNQFTTTRILTPSPVQSMAAGYFHTLLLTQTGEVWACGWNKYGQLGIPTATQFSASLVKVTGLLPISQIASHRATNLSIAMSSDQRCFVWGELRDGNLEKKYNIIDTPLKLPPFYSTVDSLLSFFSLYPNTPHSVSIPETPPSLSTRMSRMFDNPETSPDVQFVVEQRTIHAHRIILSNSLDYFARMFSEKWLEPVDPEDPIVRVTITDHSYQVFHAFLRFLYTDCLKVHFNLLPEMFELANLYLVPYLQQLCLTRMRTTLTPATCCIYYQLTNRHSLPELEDFQEELVQFASTRMSEITPTAAYRSMEPDLRDQLTNAVQNIQAITFTPKLPN